MSKQADVQVTIYQSFGYKRELCSQPAADGLYFNYYIFLAIHEIHILEGTHAMKLTVGE